MVSFGYGPSCRGWKEENKFKLHRAFWDLLDEMTQEGKFEHVAHEGHRPYVDDVDAMYEGVEIRKLTHLGPEVERELVLRAETIYRKIMGMAPLPMKVESKK